MIALVLEEIWLTLDTNRTNNIKLRLPSIHQSIQSLECFWGIQYSNLCSVQYKTP